MTDRVRHEAHYPGYSSFKTQIPHQNVQLGLEQNLSLNSFTHHKQITTSLVRGLELLCMLIQG